MNGYVRFDRFSDALASLEQLSNSIDKVNVSEQAWKFAIISSHCALQGFMCIALHDGNSFDTWKANQYKNWQKAYSEGKELPAPQLNFFLELYKKLFPTSVDIDYSLIEFLNKTRNGLVHFNADEYSIELESIILSISEALKAIELTPTLSKGIFFYEEYQEELFIQASKRAQTSIQSIRYNLSSF